MPVVPDACRFAYTQAVQYLCSVYIEHIELEHYLEDRIQVDPTTTP